MDKHGLKTVTLTSKVEERYKLWENTRCTMFEILGNVSISRLCILGNNIYFYPDQDKQVFIQANNQDQLLNILPLVNANYDRLTTSLLENMVMFGQVYEDRFYCLCILSYENKILDIKVKNKILEYCNLLSAPLIYKGFYGLNQLRGAILASVYYPDKSCASILSIPNPPIKNEESGDWLLTISTKESLSGQEENKVSNEEFESYLKKICLDSMQSKNMASILSVESLAELSHEQKLKLKKTLIMNALADVCKVYPEVVEEYTRKKVKKLIKEEVEVELKSKLT